MKTNKQLFKCTALSALLFAGFSAGSIAQDTSTVAEPETKAPVILSTIPAGDELNVDLSSVIEVTFSSDMNEESINGRTLLLHATYADTMHGKHGGHGEILDNPISDRSTIKDSENSRQYSTGPVGGTISYSDKVALFTPDRELNEGTLYTFTVTNGVKNSKNIALENDQTWSFTTTGKSGATGFDKENDRYGMDWTENSSMYAMLTNRTTSIDLGKAGHFVILAKTSVINSSSSVITGHVGEGAVATSTPKEEDIFKPTLQTTSGKVFVLHANQRNATSPDAIEAIGDMISAFGDASMQNGDDSTSHVNESFQNTVLTPGVHEWSDSLHIASDVTLSGSVDDVWLIKVGKNLTISENTVFTLTNGARADNIFWYVEDDVTIGKNAHFEGIILSINEITLEKGAKLNGRLFSQTSIILDDNTVTEPRSIDSQTSSTIR
ncbi:ice-binding family protein [Halalkalibaculum sp. DA384]|uniref:ice-binding family protein n=1 Tax=Halalkalibaculum sp. DA384 TaxID=3373606 RepID=UPI003754514D